MQSSNGYARKQPQYGWDTTSQDYHAHLSRMQRVPTALNEVPHYPSVYKVFKNKYTYGEEEKTPQEHQQKVSPPKTQKKVQMNEHVEVIESSTNENCEARQGNVDTEADGFIQRKRRGFELCKWKTFKVH